MRRHKIRGSGDEYGIVSDWFTETTHLLGLHFLMTSKLRLSLSMGSKLSIYPSYKDEAPLEVREKI